MQDFVGPTICYAFMQAVGMVDDHAKAAIYIREIEVRSNYPEFPDSWKIERWPKEQYAKYAYCKF
ncbi:MAG TPA: DNA-3-methyladenine glycosylase I [Candidatus Saccharibacteria bacterium]|jgi:hypothetical protein|nr:DNA-3-methyladenine glycosylase I [Candidatus Saccharibacteria bacterium]